MKKIITFSVLFFLSSIAVFSQDLIVTAQGDSIECKIYRIKNQRIYYGHLENNRPVKSVIAIDNTSEYKLKFFKNRHIINYFPQYDWGRARIAFNGALTSYRIAGISTEAQEVDREMLKNIKSGHAYSGEMSYLFNKHLGAGLQFNLHRSKYAMDNILFYNNQTSVVGTYSKDISIPFIGPAFYFMTTFMKGKARLVTSFSVGYLGYREKLKAPYDYRISADTIGTSFSAGLDFRVSPLVSCGFKLSAVNGAFSKYTIDDGKTKTTERFDENQFENLTHINISFGLRFHFLKRLVKK